jgi:starch synthase
MRILMVASEAAPFAKTGGLADVAGALPQALVRLGYDVDVVMPRYRGVTAGTMHRRLTVPAGPQSVETDFHTVTARGVRTIFVDHPSYYDREHLYGVAERDYADNPERFAFLCRAAVSWALAEGPYEVVHAHDWQTGLVPVLLAQMFRSGTLTTRLPAIFTIHNLAYQGTFDASWLPRLGLPWDLMRLDAIEYWGRISFLKAGIVFSRFVTTVSPRYAQEIQLPEYGFGFDGILRERSHDLIGILNGIDYDQWNPARDAYLPEPYTASNLAGKRAAKRALHETLDLPTTDMVLRKPTIGLVSRLVDQKGFDLLAAIADELPRLGATLAMVGAGERRYEDLWLGLASRYPDRIAVRLGYDERLVHLIEGGADLFLMPSRFEPCGLNQMYSLRYGTVPLVRATGGLFDTVRNFNPETGEGTGFTFDDYSPQGLLGTLRWALGVFQDQGTWERIQLAGMDQDHSWDASARRYAEVYERAAASRVWA